MGQEILSHAKNSKVVTDSTQPYHNAMLGGLVSGNIIDILIGFIAVIVWSWIFNTIKLWAKQQLTIVHKSN